jgi:hypothetical protein
MINRLYPVLLMAACLSTACGSNSTDAAIDSITVTSIAATPAVVAPVADVMLTVSASGSGVMTYQWRHAGNCRRIEAPRLWLEWPVQRGEGAAADLHDHAVWRDKVAGYGGKCG